MANQATHALFIQLTIKQKSGAGYQSRPRSFALYAVLGVQNFPQSLRYSHHLTTTAPIKHKRPAISKNTGPITVLPVGGKYDGVGFGTVVNVACGTGVLSGGFGFFVFVGDGSIVIGGTKLGIGGVLVGSIVAVDSGVSDGPGVNPVGGVSGGLDVGFGNVGIGEGVKVGGAGLFVGVAVGGTVGRGVLVGVLIGVAVGATLVEVAVGSGVSVGCFVGVNVGAGVDVGVGSSVDVGDGAIVDVGGRSVGVLVGGTGVGVFVGSIGVGVSVGGIGVGVLVGGTGVGVSVGGIGVGVSVGGIVGVGVSSHSGSSAAAHATSAPAHPISVPTASSAVARFKPTNPPTLPRTHSTTIEIADKTSIRLVVLTALPPLHWFLPARLDYILAL